MEKRANIILRFDKTDPLWSAMIKRIEPRRVAETTDNIMNVMLMVQDYDSDDHQFIRMKVKYDKQDRYIQIPRGLVSMVIEGKDLGKGALGFVVSEREVPE